MTPRRYLFGPVDGGRDGVLWHGLQGQTDAVGFGSGESWEGICQRLPAGWQPDVVVLHLHDRPVPAGLWTASVVRVVLAFAWQRQWHCYRRLLPHCHLIVSDAEGAHHLRREGIGPVSVSAALLVEGDPAIPAAVPVAGSAVDVLFVGDTHPALQRQRWPWLARLARLASRWNVHIQPASSSLAAAGDLPPARILFQHGHEPGSAPLAGRAILAGALLFRPAGDAALPAWLREGQEYVGYTSDNLEHLLGYYLEHEDERRRVVAAAQQRLHDASTPRFWSGLLAAVGEHVSAGDTGMVRQLAGSGTDALQDRVSQALRDGQLQDSTLLMDLAEAMQRRPDAAQAHALGLLQGLLPGTASRGERARAASVHFRAALDLQAGHLLAGLNLAEALALAGDSAGAVRQAQQTLRLLESVSVAADLLGWEGHYPGGLDVFRVEWERAAWAHAGDRAGEQAAKRAVLRWRLHGLLARETGERVHRYEAALAVPTCRPPALRSTPPCCTRGATRKRTRTCSRRWQPTPSMRRPPAPSLRRADCWALLRRNSR